MRWTRRRHRCDRRFGQQLLQQPRRRLGAGDAERGRGFASLGQRLGVALAQIAALAAVELPHRRHQALRAAAGLRRAACARPAPSPGRARESPPVRRAAAWRWPTDTPADSRRHRARRGSHSARPAAPARTARSPGSAGRVATWRSSHGLQAGLAQRRQGIIGQPCGERLEGLVRCSALALPGVQQRQHHRRQIVEHDLRPHQPAQASAPRRRRRRPAGRSLRPCRRLARPWWRAGRYRRRSAARRNDGSRSDGC